MGVTLFGTTLGSPAVLTPLAASLADATGLSRETVLLLQVPSWMFFLLPYQLPALLLAMAPNGIRLGQCIRVLAALTLFGVVVSLPLHFLWLRTLGYL